MHELTLRERDWITLLRHMRGTSVHSRIADKIQFAIDRGVETTAVPVMLTRSELLLVRMICEDYGISHRDAPS